MYYTIYTSSDYYDEKEKEKNNSLKEYDGNICLICLLPDKHKDLVQNMKQFSYILSTCDCNALFHSNCLETWIVKSQSCPICRIQLTYTFNYNFKFDNLIKIFVDNYTNAYFQIINFISIINLFFLLYFYVYIFSYCFII